jgi:hypothetical protein
LALDDGVFDLVVHDQNGFVKLRVVYKQYQSTSIRFDPAVDGSGKVKGRIIDNDIRFETADGSYLWLAELKTEHAQRIINKYAAEQARVGLDESEWLRRWSKRPENDELY